jgi:hypothetical protein
MPPRHTIPILILLLAASASLFGQQKNRLNGHPVVLDTQGRLLSWVTPQERAYDYVVKLAWNFIENKVPVEANGLKVYLVHSTFDPSTLRGTDWPHNPAGWEWASVPYASSDAGATEYFGADDVKYCEKERPGRGACGVGDGRYAIQPDKDGELGVGYLKFYELTGETVTRAFSTGPT